MYVRNKGGMYLSAVTVIFIQCSLMQRLLQREETPLPQLLTGSKFVWPHRQSGKLRHVSGTLSESMQ